MKKIVSLVVAAFFLALAVGVVLAPAPTSVAQQVKGWFSGDNFTK